MTRLANVVWLAAAMLGCDGTVGDADADGQDGADEQRDGDGTGDDGAGDGGSDGTDEGGSDGDGTGGADGAGEGSCGALTERIRVTEVAVDADIRYGQPGYNGVPTDARIAYSIQPSGEAQVAWMDTSGAIHVTPLDATGARRGDDVMVEGLEVGGLVAHDDGFALFTRRPDPRAAEIKFDEGDSGAAAYVVRVKDGEESWAAQITGPDGIDGMRDFSNGLVGRLAWNGEKYGAYFVIRGGKSHWAEGHYGDKLRYLDDTGAAVSGGWDWGCSHNEGIRLLAEPGGAFTSLCFSDAYPAPGLNFNTEGKPGAWLAREETWAGFSAGQFGSVVKLEDGTYLVAWLSKGEGPAKDDGGDITTYEHERAIPDIALLHLDANGAPIGERIWLTDTPDVAEQSVHLAVYGGDVLLAYRRLKDATCDATCFGTSEGVFVERLDTAGARLEDAVSVDLAFNQEDDIAVHADGDLGWAFVPSALDYTKGLDVNALPAQRTLRIARMNACD